MPLTEMVVMVAIIGALILGFIAIIRLIMTAINHKTIRQAVEKNPEQADALLAQLAGPREAGGEGRLATVLIAIGLAMAGAAVVIGEPGLVRLGIAASLFPLLVGAALWLRSRAHDGAGERESGQ